MTAKEILDWQKAFSFLRVDGISITKPVDRDGTDDISQPVAGISVAEDLILTGKIATSVEATDMNGHMPDLSLSIMGSKSAIHPLPTLDDALDDGCAVNFINDEEILVQDGILEEILAIYTTADGAVNATDVTIELTPSVVYRNDLVDSVIAEIWPLLAEALRPLVTEVVRASRKHGIVYPTVLTKIVQSDEAVPSDHKQQRYDNSDDSR